MVQIAEYEDRSQEQFADVATDRGKRGEIYFSSDSAQRHVLKLFLDDDSRPETPESAPQHLANLRAVTTNYNYVQGHPYWSALFSWPDRVSVRFGGARRSGVRMARSPLKKIDWTLESFYGQYKLLKPEQRGWWIARVAIAMKLARAIDFLATHQLAHTDISQNNVLADPYSGDAILIDCDGIVAAGSPLTAQVLGTKGYIAPELAGGEIPSPTVETDQHALAVVIYRLLLYRNPLEGSLRHPDIGRRNVTAEEEDTYTWGKGALYIAHPTDQRNRPKDAGEVFDSALLGKRINRLMNRAFITGLHPWPNMPDNARRPTAHEWEDALLRMYDRIVPCSNPGCAQRFFPMPEEPTERPICFLCKQELTGPQSVPYMRLQRIVRDHAGELVYDIDDDYTVVGWPGRLLHTWHQRTDISPQPTSQHPNYDPRPVGRFEYDTARNQWYLLNEGMSQLFVTGRGIVPIGERILLTDKLTLWLDNSRRTRMATITLRSLGAGRAGAVYELPAVEVATNRPWPTLQPTQADRAWSLGQPITLRANPPLLLSPAEKRALEAAEQQKRDAEARQKAALARLLPRASQKRFRRIISALCIPMVLGALLAGGGTTALSFWLSPEWRWFGLALLVVAGIFTALSRVRSMLWVVGVLAVGVCLQLGWYAVRQPVLALIGASVGALVGLVLTTRIQSTQAIAQADLQEETEQQEEDQLLQSIESQ